MQSDEVSWRMLELPSEDKKREHAVPSGTTYSGLIRHHKLCQGYPGRPAFNDIEPWGLDSVSTQKTTMWENSTPQKKLIKQQLRLMLKVKSMKHAWQLCLPLTVRCTQLPLWKVSYCCSSMRTLHSYQPWSSERTFSIRREDLPCRLARPGCGGDDETQGGIKRGGFNKWNGGRGGTGVRWQDGKQQINCSKPLKGTGIPSHCVPVHKAWF